MSVNLVGGTVHNVNASAVGPPPGDPRRKMFVGIGNAAVVFFLVLVFLGVGSGVAAQPELLDKLVPLFVVGELFEGGHFLIRNDPAHVFVEPLLVGGTQLLLESLGVRLLLLVGQRPLERIRLRAAGLPRRGSI